MVVYIQTNVLFWEGHTMDYKKLIVEMLDDIQNEKMIEYLYGLIKGVMKKWG